MIPMDVFVANEQSEVEITEERLISLARLAAEAEGVPARAELSILLVDKSSMASLKQRYLGEPGATDVLAFVMDDAPDLDEPYMMGDIVICPEVAREQATDAVTEVDMLLVHGFLHLIGYDHMQPQDARNMRHRERKILQEFYRGYAQ